MSVAELERAAKETASYARGVTFSPSQLADVMQQTGIAEQEVEAHQSFSAAVAYGMLRPP